MGGVCGWVWVLGGLGLIKIEVSSQ